jgi:hypothetical protein
MEIALMKSILAQLSERQATRLLNSSMSAEAFYAQPEEEAVTFEIDCYESLIAKTLEAAA